MNWILNDFITNCQAYNLQFAKKIDCVEAHGWYRVYAIFSESESVILDEFETENEANNYIREAVKKLNK